MTRTERASVYIAGSSSAVARPGRANSSYLVRTGETAIVLDMGSGAFANLRRASDMSGSLDAVIISHMHPDHFIDLIQLRYALRYEIRRGAALPIYLPPGGASVLRRMVQPLQDAGDFFEGSLELHEYTAAGTLRFGDAAVTFAPCVHYVPAYAVRVETKDGTLAYSADTAPCEAVARLASSADLFLCEAALGAAGTESGPQRGHLNAGDAGAIAAAAGVRHLVLTHYGADEDPLALTRAAQLRYRGLITVADDGLLLPIVQPAPSGLR